MDATIMNTPLVQQIQEFEQSYRLLINKLAEVKSEREKLEAELKFEEATYLLSLLSQGMKVSEAERQVDADKKFYERKRAVIEVKKNEHLCSLYKDLYDHKASFLTTLGGLTRSELEKTAMKV